MSVIIYRHDPTLGALDSLAIDAPSGALYSESGLVGCVPSGGHVRLAGLAGIETITSRALSSLTVSELQEIVAWAGVETEAQTASGLKRAIERHFV